MGTCDKYEHTTVQLQTTKIGLKVINSVIVFYTSSKLSPKKYLYQLKKSMSSSSSSLLCSSSAMNKTFYDVLEISSTAEPATIRQAFKRAVLNFHPDKIPFLEKQHNSGLPFSQEQKDAMVARFQECVKAANCLLDPQSKARYDAFALGKQMVDLTGRISETCSLKEDFEPASNSSFDEGENNEEDIHQRQQQQEHVSEELLYLRECRCGGYYSVVWSRNDSEKKKYATCDSCSLVVVVECDIL